MDIVDIVDIVNNSAPVEQVVDDGGGEAQPVLLQVVQCRQGHLDIAKY